MLVFFIHGVATRDVKYADNLKVLIRENFTKRGESIPHFYSSFWGNVLSDVSKMWNWIYQDLQEIKKNYPQAKVEDIFRYQKFREGFLSEFIGDFFTYFNTERGETIRRMIFQQLDDFIKDHPKEDELHIVAHSLGTVVLWDVLFSERFSDRDPALDIRKMINNLSGSNTAPKVNLSSITTMGSPILFANTMLNVKPEKVHDFANAYQEKSLRWINIIHASDVVAYPLLSSLQMNSSCKLSFRDEYIWDDDNLAEKAARSVGQVDIAMGLGAADGHKSYLNGQKTARLITDNILGDRSVDVDSMFRNAITRLAQVRGMTNDNSDNAKVAPVYLTFRDGSGTIRLFVNNFKVHHVYVFDKNNARQFGGFVGWLDTQGLQEELEFIKRNFC